MICHHPLSIVLSNLVKLLSHQVYLLLSLSQFLLCISHFRSCVPELGEHFVLELHKGLFLGQDYLAKLLGCGLVDMLLAETEQAHMASSRLYKLFLLTLNRIDH